MGRRRLSRPTGLFGLGGLIGVLAALFRAGGFVLHFAPVAIVTGVMAWAVP